MLYEGGTEISLTNLKSVLSSKNPTVFEHQFSCVEFIA